MAVYYSSSSSSFMLFSELKARENRAPSDLLSMLQVNAKIHYVASKGSAQIAKGHSKRMKEMLKTKIEVSVSPYDTAWVAMVPSKSTSLEPCFPECLKWVMENQKPDGSWCAHPSHPLLIKDCLSSTLACVLALQKWNIGELLVNRGIAFIGSNLWAATDKHQYSPIGFEIIFPGMIELARDLDLSLPMPEKMIHKRDVAVESLKGNTSHLGYVSEGLSKSVDWKEIIKHQRSNGSLFNSPSTTAAALTNLGDNKCFDYLSSLLNKFQYAVPTIYPLDIYMRLLMIDQLERLGISRYFGYEIESILDETYRWWMERNEELLLDPACCALAFRLLRMNGYEVLEDALVEFGQEEEVSPQAKDINCILELYRDSEITIFQNEPILDEIHNWTASSMKKKLLAGGIQNKINEVKYALNYRHASLERIETRRFIEYYRTENIHLGKSSYWCSNVSNKVFFEFALQDFNMCQALHRKELEYLERWVKSYRLNDIKFGRQKLEYCYFGIASILFEPEFSKARVSSAKNAVLITLVDDLFDYGGSMEEILNLIELVKVWDEHSVVGYYSEQVEIIFISIYDTTNDLAAKAYLQQERDIKHHLIDIWVRTLESMLMETERARNKSLPTMDDYISIGYISIGLGPVILTTLYFLGEKLPEQVIASAEYEGLYKHMCIIGRLLNDLMGIKREGAEGKLNSIPLRVFHSHGSMNEEEAARETRRVVEYHRRELLRMVLQRKDSELPKVCKDMFWKTSKMLHLFYMETDGYSCPKKMLPAINEVIHHPITLSPYSLSESTNSA